MLSPNYQKQNNLFCILKLVMKILDTDSLILTNQDLIKVSKVFNTTIYICHICISHTYNLLLKFHHCLLAKFKIKIL